MEVTLNVLRCPDSVVPEMRRVGGGEYRLGRGAENDWVLPDPDRVLSKQHCVIEFHNGGWQVRDTSTNGTFHNGSSMPIGRDLTAYLHDGDRIRLGPYDIEVRIQQQGAQPGHAAQQPAWGAPPPAAQPQWDAPLPSSGPQWGAEPAWSAPQQKPQPIQPRMAGDAFAIGGPDAPPLPGMGPGGVGQGDPRFTDEGPAMPDHVSPMNAAFYVPPALPTADPHAPPPLNFAPTPPSPGAAPHGAAPPDGWSLDFGGQPAAPGGPAPAPLPGMAPPATPQPALAPPPPQPVQQPVFAPPPMAAPVPPPAPPPFAPAPAPPPVAAPNPFENEPSLHAPGMAPIAPPVPVTAPPPAMPLAAAPPVAPPPMPAPAMAPPAVAAAPMPPPAVTATHSGAVDASAVAALMAGMGLAPTPALSADPNATLRAAGAALRAAISGIRALLIARADVKREFRIEATMLGVANNPVKFSHNDDAALLALLGSAAIGPGAVQETVNDLTAHQVATLAATQAAARALLDRMAPAGIEGTDQGGSLFGASREKRLWEAYKRLHQQVMQQFEDDFDSAFGKAFARAYEQALRDGRG